jgi:hypothetical protein
MLTRRADMNQPYKFGIAGPGVEHRPRAMKDNCFALNGLGPGTS